MPAAAMRPDPYAEDSVVIALVLCCTVLISKNLHRILWAQQGHGRVSALGLAFESLTHTALWCATLQHSPQFAFMRCTVLHGHTQQPLRKCFIVGFNLDIISASPPPRGKGLLEVCHYSSWSPWYAEANQDWLWCPLAEWTQCRSHSTPVLYDNPAPQLDYHQMPSWWEKERINIS